MNRAIFFIIRNIAYIFLQGYEEEQDIYVYFSTDYKEIVYISFQPVNKHINIDMCKIYIPTLKSLYLYCLISEYQHAPLDALVLFANRVLRDHTMETIAIELNISYEKYKGLETGAVKFTGDASYEAISKKLNIDIKEFHFSFINSFKEVKESC